VASSTTLPAGVAASRSWVERTGSFHATASIGEDARTRRAFLGAVTAAGAVVPTITASEARAIRSPHARGGGEDYIARRTKPSVVPSRVKLTFTLDLPRELAELLSARAIREGKNLEAVVIEALRKVE